LRPPPPPPPPPLSSSWWWSLKHLSGCLIDNLTNSFHIFKQRFILPRWQSPPQSLLGLFGKFCFVWATRSTGNNKEIISCLSVLRVCGSQSKF
jgi:hypothetical protein